MCARAFWTVLPWGSRTAFFGVMIIFAFMAGGLPRNCSSHCWAKEGAEARAFLQGLNFPGQLPMNNQAARKSGEAGLDGGLVCRIETRLHEAKRPEKMTNSHKTRKAKQ